MQERRFEGRGPSLNVAIGPESGAPLLLLHGVSRRWTDWSVLLPALTARWTVHALDFRGHGRSDRAAPDGYHVRDYAADVVDYLRQAVGRPSAVVGHSLGGIVAACVAADAPDLVLGVVLEDPPFDMMGRRIDETDYRTLFSAYRGLAGDPRPPAEIARALAEIRMLMPGHAEPRRLGDVREAAALRYQASCLKRVDPHVFDPITAGAWLEGVEPVHVLGAIACPVLFLQGEEACGGMLADDYAGSLTSRVREVIHVRVPGAGHSIHQMMPDVMMRHAAAFLESLV